MSHVAIVGGGIAGLATAYCLDRLAHAAGTPLWLTVLEGERRWGGKITTERTGDFLIEGGPDSFLAQKPQALALCRELGLGERVIGMDPTRRGVYVARGGRLVRLPEGMNLVAPTRARPFLASPLLSPLGKLRMALDLVVPPRRAGGDESMAAFVRRRVGGEALDRIGAPLLAGIHLGDPERLSIQATFPRLVEFERTHGSLIRGARAAARGARLAPGGAPPSPFQTLRGGVGELVEALVGALGPAVARRAGAAVADLERAPDGGFALRLADGERLAADAVVLATPARDAARLVRPWAPELAERLGAIRYVSSATVSLGYRRADVAQPLDGTGFVVPASERRRIVAATWSSSKFAGRAGPEGALLRAFVGGYRDEAAVGLDDAALIELARDELAALMGSPGLLAARPLVARVYRWVGGSPQYEVGHLERVEEIERRAAGVPGLYLTGSSYRGVGIPDCVAQAQATARRLFDEIAAGGAGAGPGAPRQDKTPQMEAPR